MLKIENIFSFLFLIDRKNLYINLIFVNNIRLKKLDLLMNKRLVINSFKL